MEILDILRLANLLVALSTVLPAVLLVKNYIRKFRYISKHSNDYELKSTATLLLLLMCFFLGTAIGSSMVFIQIVTGLYPTGVERLIYLNFYTMLSNIGVLALSSAFWLASKNKI